MKIKKISMALFLCVVFSTNVFASVIGELKESTNIDFGAGTQLYKNSFENSDAAQKEFFVEYTPNSESIPIVLNGEQIYGKRTIKEAAKYFDNLNYRPLIGVNADYFSFKTGIPMGHTISGGELITKDTTGQNAVGFKADGSAFISWLEIQSKIIREDGNEMSIDCINKWCYPGAVVSYFMSDYFGKETKTSENCRFIIFKKTSGDIRIGEDCELLVEDKFDADFNIAIPEDRYILAMEIATGNPEQLAFMESLTVGEKLIMKNESVYDKELWASAENGLGSVGGRLIENGEVYTNFEKGSAPRTAVGIREDGKIIFYVVDGRQPSHSIGLSLEALAKRMGELGCIDAINLDGGGSTAIAGIYPGSDTFEVLNKPSEGTLRACANYIFLQDMRKPTGIEKTIVLNNEENGQYLTGTKVKVDVESVWDTANFKMKTGAVSYEISNSDGAESVLENGEVTLLGNGKTEVLVKVGKAEKKLSMNVYNFPDEIKIGGKELDTINLKPKEEYSLDLKPTAFVGGHELKSDHEVFSYETEGDIGSISGSVFYANTQKEAEGKIKIYAGDFVKIINVRVVEDNYFSDMKSHWAKDAVNALYKKGIITGEEKDGERYYNPDNFMTRIEFSSLICKYLGIDVLQYENTELLYDDADSLDEWMLNYAKAMTELSYINGIDGNFKPRDYITRAQAATVIGRITAEEENLAELSFSDVFDVPEWAYPHFAKLIKNGVLKGYEDNTIKPNRNVTRAEAGMVIYNLLR